MINVGFFLNFFVNRAPGDWKYTHSGNWGRISSELSPRANGSWGAGPHNRAEQSNLPSFDSQPFLQFRKYFKTVSDKEEDKLPIRPLTPPPVRG